MRIIRGEEGEVCVDVMLGENDRMIRKWEGFAEKIVALL